MKHGSIISSGAGMFFVRFWAALAAVWLTLCPRGEAQFLSIGISNSPSPVLVGSPVIYTINLTNVSSFAGGAVVALTNMFPSTVQLLSVTNFTPGLTTFSNITTGFFILFPLGSGVPAQTIVALEPTQAGAFTNTILLSAQFGSLGTFNFSTNIVTTAITPPPLEADLAVAVTGPAQFVITNDWMTYSITATNLGPDDATNVVVTNTLPPGVRLISASQSYSVSGSNLLANLGVLTNGGFASLQFTIEPTNAGLLALSASIGSTNVTDPNPTNNFASTNINILTYLPGALVAVTNSGQSIDFADGVMEQSIMLSNIGTNDVPAARVVVTGLTNRLFNAVGTNNGYPFVYYSPPVSLPLAAGQSVNLQLEYFPRGNFPFTNGQLQAFGVPLPAWPAPAETAISTNFNPSLLPLSNGNILLGWPAASNRTYTVVYSDNVLFSNAQIAPPSIVAPGNYIQWLDYGPPTTATAPTNAAARFYRVMLNP